MQDLEPFDSQDDEIPMEQDEPQETESLRGTLRRASDGCGWLLNGIDVNAYLARYNGHQVTLVITPIDAPSPAATGQLVCRECGFPLDDLGECLRCQWYNVVKARRRREELFQEIDRIVEQSWTEPYA
jgi:hypothetical protein